MTALNAAEARRIQTYMQRKFHSPGIEIRIRDKAPESAEVMMNGEFIGTLYKDNEDGETSYDFNMAILDVDLEDAA